MRLYTHELKTNLKNFLIWTICISCISFGCILMYSSVADQLENIGDVFANMGAMSTALGMDRMSLSTLSGYYATEIAMIHALGGAMFAAILGSNMLAKEEFGHTTEFLMVLPMSRVRIVLGKAAALVTYIVLFQIVNISIHCAGIACMGEDVPWADILPMTGLQLLMLIEIAGICFALSAFSRRNMMGAGLGIALLLFAADMMCRIVPAIEGLKYVTPFYYSNAADVFTDTAIPSGALAIAIIVTVVAFAMAVLKYRRKDLAS